NPQLVYCSISGFGQQGPRAPEAGHEFNYQAYAGMFVASPQGGAPHPAGALVGDQGGGMAAAFSILAALLNARRTGEGAQIDVSSRDLLLSWSAPVSSIAETPGSTRKTDAPGMGVFRTADGGHVVLCFFREHRQCDARCRFLGLRCDVGLGM